MQYALLGETGLLVSRLAFGVMTFTAGNHDIGAVYKVGAELADELVGRALDRGVTFFDTADGYAGGESEALLGRALRHRRDSVVIATKVGFRTGAPLTQAALSRRHITWSVEQSLTRLGTDWIDVYLAHWEDPYTPLEETLSAFDAVVASGKVRYIGFSNWSAWKVAAPLEIQKANSLAPFTHGQMHYSLLERDVGRDIVPMMQRYGLGMTVWNPLASGFLSYAGFDILPFDKEHGFGVVDRLRAIAGRHDASVAQTALAWLLARPSVTSVLIGAAKLAQLDDNLGAADVHLTSDDIAELDAATPLHPVYPNWYIDSLTNQPVNQALAGLS